MPLRLRPISLGLPALLALGLIAPGEPVAVAQPKAADPTFDQTIKPFLTTYCVSCHNSKKPAGELALDVYLSEAHARKDRKAWESVEKRLVAGDMPPKKSSRPRPTKAETEFVLNWVETTVMKVEFTDIVFAIDSILVAVAMSNKTWVILTGGILGIIMMRLVIGQLLAIVERYPPLVDGAFIIIAWVAVKLFVEYLHAKHYIAYEIPKPLSLGLIAVIFLASYLFARSKGPAPDSDDPGPHVVH